MNNFDLRKYLAEGRLFEAKSNQQIKNKYTTNIDGFYSIDTSKALNYLSQFDNEEVDAEQFINADEGLVEFINHVEDLNLMSDKELEDIMRQEMSFYYYSDRDSIEDLDEGKLLKEAYTPGSGWTEDFEYDDMMAHGLMLTADDSIEDLRKVAEDFTDVNYHREAAHLYDAIDSIEAGNRGEAEMYIDKFRKEIKNTLAGWDDVNEAQEDEAKNDIKEDNSSDYELIVSLLGKLAGLAEKNIGNSDNFDLEDMSQVIEGYYDEMKELGGFEKYDDEDDLEDFE